MGSVLVSFFAVIVGLAAGSFANAVLWRVGRGETVVWARSKCPKCDHKLSAFDLVPVVSFLALGGRCRYCSRPISWRYPVVEIVFGLGFLYIANNLMVDWSQKAWLGGIFLVLLLIFLYDLKHLIIPDAFALSGSVWAVAGILYFKPGEIWQHLATGASIFLFFAALYFFSRGKWVGGGDAKLGFFLGAWLGWPMGLVALLLAYALGAVVGVTLLIAGAAKPKSKIPFGPFLATGAVVAYLYGEGLVRWYAHLLV